MKVLIVDDAMFLRLALRKILEKNGFEVIGEASDGNEAIQMYKELSPDVVTMDITMPGKNGIEALKEIVAFHPEAKIVMCSAMGRSDFIKDAILAGARDFITKPFDEKKVIEVLNFA